MKAIRFMIPFILIILIYNLYQESVEEEEENLQIYDNDKIDIITYGDFLIIEQRNDLRGPEWNVSPKMENGLRLFKDDLYLSDRIIDSYGNKTCFISVLAGSFCWNFNSDNMVSEHIFMENYTFNSISVGGNHVCSISENDKKTNINCWGSNIFGQLGHSESNQTSGIFSTKSPDAGEWKEVLTGQSHTCGVTTLEKIYCWGDNSFGQLGNNINASNEEMKELKVNLEGGIKSISSGGYHNCLIDFADDLFCWGWNGYGQIGDGTHINSYNPVKIDIPTDKIIISISTGQAHTCVLLTDGESYCWGNNENGQINNFAELSYNYPEKIDFTNIIEIFSGNNHNCFLSGNEELMNCLGGDQKFDREITRDLIRQYSSGLNYNCFLNYTGPISCDGVVDFDNFSYVSTAAKSAFAPEEIKAGSIAIIPSENLSEEYSISLIVEDIEYRDNIKIVVDYGEDIDGDGWSNTKEYNCFSDKYDPYSFPSDYDSDKICDYLDWDDDGDGYSDEKDIFPYDSDEWRDDDGDGIGKNADDLEITDSEINTILTTIILICLIILELYFDKKEDKILTRNNNDV